MSSLVLADNRLLDGVPVASHTAAGYDALNIRDLRTYTFWKSSWADPSTITVDCGSAKGADSFGVVRHNLGTVQSQVSVESSDDGVNWTSRLSAAIPFSDKPFLRRFTTASARWWRVSFNAQTAPAQVAVLLLGMGITFPRLPDAPFAKVEVRQESERAVSKTGQLIGSIVRFKGLQVSPQWSYLEKDFVDNQLWPFYRDYSGAGNPFLWSWDPVGHSDEVHFVRLKEGFSFAPAKSLLTYYDRVSLEMEGVLE